MPITTKHLVKNASNLFDTIKVVQQLEKLPMQIIEEIKEPFEWKGYIWKPIYSKYSNIPNAYYSKLDNLYMSIRGNEMTVQNSLQKFYMGNNYESFSYTQVVKAVDKLNAVLPFNIYNAKVKRVAIGAVIEEDTEPILNSWLNLLNKQPTPMLSRNKMYGLKYFLTEYDVKGYNKTTEVKVHNNLKLNNQLFRFEVEVKRINNLNRGKNLIGIYTVQDLLDPIKYLKLADYMLAKYESINKTPVINLSQTTIKEKRMIASFKDAEILSSIKKNHPDTYKKERKEYKSLLNKLHNDEYQTSIINKLKEQIQYSINN